MSNYDYEREAVESVVADLAETRLEGPHTLQVTAWQDGDFEVTAFHTINTTYPEMVDALETDGLPYYREQIIFETVGDEEGWVRHEVVRRYTEQRSFDTVYSERVGGYTPNWPAPLEEDDEEGDGATYPDSTAFRFA